MFFQYYKIEKINSKKFFVLLVCCALSLYSLPFSFISLPYITISPLRHCLYKMYLSIYLYIFFLFTVLCIIFYLFYFLFGCCVFFSVLLSFKHLYAMQLPLEEHIIIFLQILNRRNFPIFIYFTISFFSFVNKAKKHTNQRNKMKLSGLYCFRLLFSFFVLVVYWLGP